jgi:MOSC domain-containing protein YiiM
MLSGSHAGGIAPRRGNSGMALMGKVVAICVGEKKGARKSPVPSAVAVADYGLEGDAHAGRHHRQISLLALEKIDEFRKRGALVSYGDFGENIVGADVDFAKLPVGTRLLCGEVELEITQIGKECHTRCSIYHAMGECIMPTQGVFARVLRGGAVRPGDGLTVRGKDAPASLQSAPRARP